jgi:hypothetical protein
MGVAHRPGVGLAEDQHLLIPLRQDFLPASEPVLATAERGDSVSERLPVNRLIIEALRDRLVHRVEPVEIVRDLLLGVGEVATQRFGACDVLGARDGSHLGAIQRHHPAGDQATVQAELDEGGARGDDGCGVVVSEGSDGAVVGRELLQQPESFEITGAGALEMTRRAELV